MLSRFTLVALAACAALSLAVHAADTTDVPDPDTTVLTDANFESFVSGELSLVEFYAPCKSLAPEYAKAATELKALGVPLGKLDATVHSKTAGAHSISGYPTLKVFRNGQSSDYNGPRKADGIVAFMKKQTGPASKTISTDAELQKLLQQEPSVQYVILGLFNDGKASQLQSSWSLLTARLRDEFLFARTNDPALKAAYGVAADAEALIAFLYSDRTTYTGSSKTSDVESWIRQNSLPLVGEYSEQTQAHYSARKLPVAKLFLNVDRKPRSQTMKYYTNRLKKLAEQFRGKLLVAYADRAGSKAQLDHLNMADEDHGFVVEDPAANKLWRFEPDEAEAEAAKKSKGLNIPAWAQFCEDVLAGDVPVYTRSQRAPKNNAALPVKMATGANFEDLVNDDDKDVLIEFYAPWCGHCKALEPKYEQLGKAVLADPALAAVTIAKLDATANDYDRSAWEVKGYPTIFFKPAGKKPQLYDGAREADDMLKFIKANGKTVKKGKGKGKKAGGKKKKQAKKKKVAVEDDDEAAEE